MAHCESFGVGFGDSGMQGRPLRATKPGGCANNLEFMEKDVVTRLREFIETEARSGSMDFGCITPLYVYRMWGGSISIDEIEAGLMELRKQGLLP